MFRKLFVFSLAVFAIPMILKGQDPKLTEDWSHKPTVIEGSKNRKSPSDAIVLFKKRKDISNWVNRKGDPAGWKTSCRTMTTSQTGNILTKQEFGDCQLHLEWKTPRKIIGDGQGRGNSGVYVQTLYEIQILDSYENETYYNGQAGSVYKQSSPLVNASRKPGKWQVYDIIFHAPRFNEDGSLKSPATFTAFHNGVLIQDNFELKGPSVYGGYPKYTPHPEKMPILLQDHGNPVKFRNIWIREL